MRAVKLKKKDLSSFLECIRTWGELWGPVPQGDRYVLKWVDDPNRLALFAQRTTLPFKKLWTPPKFSMFGFSGKNYTEQLGLIGNRILVGLHPCDIHALLIMDEFHAKHHPDPYYLEHRKRTAIVGFSCVPDEKCFCNATHTDSVEEGFDLFLTDLDDFFLIWIGSSLGDDLVRSCPNLVQEKVSPCDVKLYIDWQKERNTQFKMDIDLTSMPDIMELSSESAVWEDDGKRCLSCGACTIVCPTCPCFNVYDQTRMDKLEGERIRQWDSCQFREYSMVAGGHNFRAARSERLKLRFTHKLQAWVGEFGKPACVGCGRCIGTCPVDIDIQTVVKKLQGEEVSVCQ